MLLVCQACFLGARAYAKAEDGVHYCEERFLEVARRAGVLGMPATHVSLEEAFKAHASQAWLTAAALRKCAAICFGGLLCHNATLSECFTHSVGRYFNLLNSMCKAKHAALQRQQHHNT